MRLLLSMNRLFLFLGLRDDEDDDPGDQGDADQSGENDPGDEEYDGQRQFHENARTCGGCRAARGVHFLSVRFSDPSISPEGETRKKKMPHGEDFHSFFLEPDPLRES